MNIIFYPSKKFLSCAIINIMEGDDFYIKLSNKWNSKLITSRIIDLIIDEKSEEKSWEFVFCIYLNLNFFSAYFYVFSKNYRLCQVNKIHKLVKFYKIK